jgi:NAD(P)-dependent dehydrogenase (short-subunit alcohol dehydrogenase family)
MISMNKTNPAVALVTGASSGIGRATAKALLGAGYRVFGTSRRAAAESVDGVTMLACDVTDDESVAKLVDEVLAKAGRIDLLVNNAGLGLFGGAEESSMAQAKSLNGVVRKAMEKGDAPEVVAKTVLAAATDPAPKRRYAAGKMARQVSILRRFVPASAFDKSLRKQLGLPA